jgi:hypothetical protein
MSLLDKLEWCSERLKENFGLPVVPPRLTLDYCGCAYCKIAKAALEDAWDAHRSGG